MEETLGLLLFVLKVVVIVVALPVSLLVATPFIMLIPGKAYCDECGETGCECNKSKTRRKFIAKRYGKVIRFWAEFRFWLV